MIPFLWGAIFCMLLCMLLRYPMEELDMLF